jgi:hypothetical protein
MGFCLSIGRSTRNHIKFPPKISPEIVSSGSTGNGQHYPGRIGSLPRVLGLHWVTGFLRPRSRVLCLCLKIGLHLSVLPLSLRSLFASLSSLLRRKEERKKEEERKQKKKEEGTRKRCKSVQ